MDEQYPKNAHVNLKTREVRFVDGDLGVYIGNLKEPWDRLEAFAKENAALKNDIRSLIRALQRLHPHPSPGNPWFLDVAVSKFTLEELTK